MIYYRLGCCQSTLSCDLRYLVTHVSRLSGRSQTPTKNVLFADQRIVVELGNEASIAAAIAFTLVEPLSKVTIVSIKVIFILTAHF